MLRRLILALLVAVPATVTAQDHCAVDTLNAGYPDRWNGTVLRQIVVRPQNVTVPIRLLEPAAHMAHVTTRPGIVLREIDLPTGKPADSLEVQESARRLRASGLYTQVIVTGRVCADSLELSYLTYDAWSLRPDARFGRNQSRVAISDVNLIGTGRTLGVQLEAIDDRQAASAVYVDPRLFGSWLSGTAMLRSYGDGRSWFFGVRERVVSPLDRWRFLATSTQVRRKNDDLQHSTLTDLSRRNLAAMLGRVVDVTPTGVWVVQAGMESQFADLAVVRLGRGLGRPDVQREYAAPALGFTRQSLTYGAVDWLVPGQRPAELPTGVGGDVAVSRGQELRTGKSITHLDGWIGVTAQWSPDWFVSADAWIGGYWNSDSVSDGSLRMAVSLHRRATRGWWSVRISDERIDNPDPDVFALTNLDPLLRSLSPTARISDQATSATIERDVLMQAERGASGLYGAAFITASSRHNTTSDVADPVPEMRSLIVGMGVRRVFSQPTQTPLRFDFGRGMYRSSRIPDRWVFVVTATPWSNAGRGRSGTRDLR